MAARRKLSDRSETARRITAARILRGWEQWELNDLLDEAEVGKEMASRLETDDTPFPGPRRDAVAKVLGVPVEWFTAPVDQLLAVGDNDGDRLEERLDAIEEKLSRLLRAADAAALDDLDDAAGDLQ